MIYVRNSDWVVRQLCPTRQGKKKKDNKLLLHSTSHYWPLIMLVRPGLPVGIFLFSDWHILENISTADYIQEGDVGFKKPKVRLFIKWVILMSNIAPSDKEKEAKSQSSRRCWTRWRYGRWRACCPDNQRSRCQLRGRWRVASCPGSLSSSQTPQNEESLARRIG